MPETAPTPPPAAAPTPPRRELRVPPGTVVVVGGIPGAGKSTLITRLARPGLRTLDPDRIRARWRRVAGRRLPYRLYRPLVHVEHHVTVAVALLRPGALVVHECATRSSLRRLVATLARLGGHPCHVVLLDVDPAEARRGQRVRGRVVPAESMRGHAARWARLRAELAAGSDRLHREGFAGWEVLDRPAAAALERLEVSPREQAGAPGA